MKSFVRGCSIAPRETPGRIDRTGVHEETVDELAPVWIIDRESVRGVSREPSVTKIVVGGGKVSAPALRKENGEISVPGPVHVREPAKVPLFADPKEVFDVSRHNLPLVVGELERQARASCGLVAERFVAKPDRDIGLRHGPDRHSASLRAAPAAAPATASGGTAAPAACPACPASAAWRPAALLTDRRAATAVNRDQRGSAWNFVAAQIICGDGSARAGKVICARQPVARVSTSSAGLRASIH